MSAAEHKQPKKAIINNVLLHLRIVNELKEVDDSTKLFDIWRLTKAEVANVTPRDLIKRCEPLLVKFRAQRRCCLSWCRSQANHWGIEQVDIDNFTPEMLSEEERKHVEKEHKLCARSIKYVATAIVFPSCGADHTKIISEGCTQASEAIVQMQVVGSQRAEILYSVAMGYIYAHANTFGKIAAQEAAARKQAKVKAKRRHQKAMREEKKRLERELPTTTTTTTGAAHQQVTEQKEEKKQAPPPIIELAKPQTLNQQQVADNATFFD